MAQQVLSVTQINNYIKNMMDRDSLLCSLAVRGEVSNYKLYPSGHHYFTLKDAGGAIRCVMFKGNANSLLFKPRDGMKVIAMGRISVFPRDGAYQLYCNGLVMDGVGDLYAAFEQTKARLAAQGLFDQSHKKPIPAYPQVIGIVTSPSGDALHDILRILRKRYPLARVRLLPSRVQGVEAPQEIANAIAYANYYHLADLLIVGRGGGSMEDLNGFNSEVVAYAIYHSQIPIISAVGHEPDVTIADLVADLRAATPSNGAELAVPDQNALRQSLDHYQGALNEAMGKTLKSARQTFAAWSDRPVLKSPTGYIEQRRSTLDLLKSRLLSAQSQSIHEKKQQFVALTAKLDAMSPLKVLTRGYAYTTDSSGNVVQSVKQVAPGDDIHIALQDGVIHAAVTETKENVQ